jgi:hypothetical protein
VFATVAPSVTPQATPVDFELVVMQTEPPQTSVLFNVTLQAKLNASLTNLGDSDAHNVRVQLRARVGNSYIKINGADPFVVNIGDLAARTATSQNLTLEMKMSLAQGRQAQNEGMVFEIAVLSNERTKQFPNMLCTQAGCT